jgi:hypothetical protein
MALDSWGVLPGLEKDEFVLAFQDPSPDLGKPFMRMHDPVSEEKMREDLKSIGVSEAQADVAIAKAKAKAEWKENPRT